MLFTPNVVACTFYNVDTVFLCIFPIQSIWQPRDGDTTAGYTKKPIIFSFNRVVSVFDWICILYPTKAFNDFLAVCSVAQYRNEQEQEEHGP